MTGNDEQVHVGWFVAVSVPLLGGCIASVAACASALDPIEYPIAYLDVAVSFFLTVLCGFSSLVLSYNAVRYQNHWLFRRAFYLSFGVMLSPMLHGLLFVKTLLMT